LLNSALAALVSTTRAKIRSELGYAADEVDVSGKFDRRFNTQDTLSSSP
jgi:hypothetical protein